jgi:hypothetical protein
VLEHPADIVALLGGDVRAARICGYTSDHLQARGADLARRGFPRSRWDLVIAYAEEHGLPITLEVMHRVHPARGTPLPPPRPRPRDPDLFGDQPEDRPKGRGRKR